MNEPAVILGDAENSSDTTGVSGRLCAPCAADGYTITARIGDRCDTHADRASRRFTQDDAPPDLCDLCAAAGKAVRAAGTHQGLAVCAGCLGEMSYSVARADQREALARGELLRVHPTGELAWCGPCAAAGRSTLGVTRSPGLVCCDRCRKRHDVAGLLTTGASRVHDPAACHLCTPALRITAPAAPPAPPVPEQRAHPLDDKYVSPNRDVRERLAAGGSTDAGVIIIGKLTVDRPAPRRWTPSSIAQLCEAFDLWFDDYFESGLTYRVGETSHTVTAKTRDLFYEYVRVVELAGGEAREGWRRVAVHDAVLANRFDGCTRTVAKHRAIILEAGFFGDPVPGHILVDPATGESAGFSTEVGLVMPLAYVPRAELMEELDHTVNRKQLAEHNAAAARRDGRPTAPSRPVHRRPADTRPSPGPARVNRGSCPTPAPLCPAPVDSPCVPSSSRVSVDLVEDLSKERDQLWARMRKAPYALAIKLQGRGDVFDELSTKELAVLVEPLAHGGKSAYQVRVAVIRVWGRRFGLLLPTRGGALKNVLRAVVGEHLAVDWYRMPGWERQERADRAEWLRLARGGDNAYRQIPVQPMEVQQAGALRANAVLSDLRARRTLRVLADCRA